MALPSVRGRAHKRSRPVKKWRERPLGHSRGRLGLRDGAARRGDGACARVEAAAGSGAKGSEGASLSRTLNDKRIFAWLRRNYLPIGLAAAAAVGFAVPTPFAALSEAGGVKAAIVAVFFLSGLGLKWDDVSSAFLEMPAIGYSMLSILLLTPLLGAALAGVLPLEPAELKSGMCIFSCVPTTLSSGVALTQAAGGHAALSLLLVVGSNLLGVLTMPAMVPRIFRSVGGLQISPVAFLMDLVQAVFVPLALGRGLRTVSVRAREAANANKSKFSAFSSVAIIATVAMQMSKASGKVGAAAGVPISTILSVSCFAAGMHCTFLCMNALACRLFRFGRSRGTEVAVTRAVVILSSQKTLPVAASVVNALSPSLGAAGLLVLPCVAGHLLQNVIDSVLVSRWTQRPG